MVYSKNIEDDEQTLRKVFQQLKEKNLTLNKKKCEFAKSRMKFMRYIFSSSGVSPDPCKVEAILKTERPESASAVCSFLGMGTYVGRFINNMASVAKLLREPKRRISHGSGVRNRKHHFSHSRKVLMKLKS